MTAPAESATLKMPLSQVQTRGMSKSSEMLASSSESEADDSSATSQSSSPTASSRSLHLTTDESVAANEIEHVTYQQPSTLNGSQNFTFKHLFNTTPQPSPQPTRSRSAGSATMLVGPEILPPSLPSPAIQVSRSIISPDIDNEKIPLEDPGSTEARGSIPNIGGENDSLHQDPSASMQLVGPSGMIEPIDKEIGMSLHSMRLSDVSVATEDGIEVAAYNVKDEVAPEEPFFSHSFQSTLRENIQIANETAAALNICARSLTTEDVLSRLRADAATLSSFQGSDTRTIAILGDSGEGKSSLINSLLHLPEVAKTGDIGSACTSVVTEYRQRKPNQIAAILLEVEYLSTSQIEHLIKELLWDFRKFYLPHVESETTSAQDYARWQKESEQAWSALESAFKHKQQFNEQFLRDTSGGALERITMQLISWTAELEWPEGGQDGVWSSTAESPEECCAKTSLFMRDQFWPFTKVIRVFLSAQVLKTGVVLADLPGLHDTNLARVRTTQAYLMRCDLFLIVANIARAITNQSLKSSLHTVLSRHMPMEWDNQSSRRSPNFAFVCTMTENFNVETEKRDFCGPDKSISSMAMRQLDDEIEQAKRRGDRTLKKKLKRKQEVMLMDARNEYVKRGLRQAYSTRIPSGHLEVFCVSNAWYRKYTRKGNNAMVHASGIPELRRFCHSVTAQAQLLEAQNFMQAKMQGLLNSVDLWATSNQNRTKKSKTPSPKIFEDELRAIHKQMLDDIRDAESSFSQTFNDMISQYFGQRDQFWEAEASARHDTWTGWHWSQYNAWCMNNGSHATPKRDFVDWNAEIIWKMRSDLAFEWSILEDEVSTCFSDILKDIKQSLRELKQFTRSHELSPLVENGIDSRFQDLTYQTGLLQESFSKEIGRIHAYAFEPCGNSYILGQMIPAYRAASRESGAGKSARQIAHVRRKIEGGALFPNIAFGIRSDMEPLISDTFSRVQKLARHSLRSIKDDILTSLPSQQSQPSAANDKEIQATKKLAITIEALKKRHVAALEEIQDF